MFFVFLGLAVADVAFLGLWFFLGFGVQGDAARAEWHQLGGLMVCILTCFVHAVTFVYFLGTGLAVKEARTNWGIDPNYIRHTRRYKLMAYPIAMVAIGFTIATGILGGAVRSGDVSATLHFTIALLATGTTIAAFAIAARFILRNGFMMGLVRADIAEIRDRARSGGEAVGPGGPLLLRRPEDVKKPPQGYLFHRAALFLGLSSWLLYAYLQWWFPGGPHRWVPFAVLSTLLLTMSIYLRIRHPLPADVDF